MRLFQKYTIQPASDELHLAGIPVDDAQVFFDPGQPVVAYQQRVMKAIVFPENNTVDYRIRGWHPDGINPHNMYRRNLRFWDGHNTSGRTRRASSTAARSEQHGAND